ncbi:MAG: bis(5'-nucleosyl)-tetraphosphatase (symmetrical) YqeK [Erysipelotrichaceae bacterium]|nr:bis(5'-nucleosyl)-tetraphosphatase (symmetrical) YqeK [Erysipelotrichaceae bacterium]
MSKQIDDFHLLDSSTRKFILNNDEVLIDLVKTNLSEYRFIHSLGVAKLAKELAYYHHVDPHKAWIAGILHDLTKELSEEEQNEYLRYYDSDKLDYPRPVKHSFTCKYYLKDKLNYHDKDVLNAIYNHTILKSYDKLSLILYVADKREENRNINDEVVDVAKKDLKKAYRLLQEKFKKLKEENGN